MSDKDYSHIKQGMYVLKEDIKDENTWYMVRKAFESAGAILDVDRKTYRCWLSDIDKYYGWDKEGDLYIHPELEDTGMYTQVSVDFILNGPEKTEETSTTEGNSLAALGKQLFGKKMQVNPETSKLVQEAVFAAGGSWVGRDGIRLAEAKFLFVSEERGLLSYTRDSAYFKMHYLTEVEIKPITTFEIIDKSKEEDLNKLKELEEQVEELKLKLGISDD